MGSSLRGFREFNPKQAASTGSRFNPNVPTHALNSLTDQGQADARPGISVCVMQPLENTKDSLVLFRRNSDAFILHVEAHEFAFVLCPDSNFWSHAWRGKFQGVGQKVLHN